MILNNGRFLKFGVEVGVEVGVEESILNELYLRVTENGSAV
jgi:hypothetical protein